MKDATEKELRQSQRNLPPRPRGRLWQEERRRLQILKRRKAAREKRKKEKEKNKVATTTSSLPIIEDADKTLSWMRQRNRSPSPGTTECKRSENYAN